jgi:tyrosyl-tRNA synthetase
MTMPLLEGLDGVQKMSKSLGNYIGITESPTQIFGKTMSIPDSLMIKYYELLTGISKAEIDRIKEGLKSGILHPKDVKKRLGKMLVTTFHNAKAADDAEKEFENVFKDGGLPDNIPVVSIPGSEFEGDGSIWLPKAMVLGKVAEGTTAATRLIEQGGVEVEGAIIKDKKTKIKLAKETLIKVGKRKFVRIKRGT